MLPCTAVSFKIFCNEKFEFDINNTDNSSVFCYLPLQNRTTLSFNINANFFLTSTREEDRYNLLVKRSY
jgi:hypothetical protein